MKAVILAGGKGTRLSPYTTIFPKPLMPLGHEPILEIVLKQLKKNGFNEVILAVGYLAELIKAYFGDGKRIGLKIQYSKEESPLGTAGPLSLIKGLESTFLVMNGDILTTISYTKLIKFHKHNKSIATIAVSNRELNVNYGVIKLKNDSIINSYDEKPILNYQVSMGIYMFEPAVFKYIPKEKYLDFPNLVNKLIKNGEKVIAYKSRDYWLDIGRKDDYEKAQEEFKKIRNKIING
jgi:NDP-sugar pyrophosphorylase family protein